jgi:hypothetical protein
MLNITIGSDVLGGFGNTRHMASNKIFSEGETGNEF